jgi:hypothetical protein
MIIGTLRAVRRAAWLQVMGLPGKRAGAGVEPSGPGPMSSLPGSGAMHLTAATPPRTLGLQRREPQMAVRAKCGRSASGPRVVEVADSIGRAAIRNTSPHIRCMAAVTERPGRKMMTATLCPRSTTCTGGTIFRHTSVATHALRNRHGRGAVGDGRSPSSRTPACLARSIQVEPPTGAPRIGCCGERFRLRRPFHDLPQIHHCHMIAKHTITAMSWLMNR